EYSEWIPVKFSAGLGFTAHGICRFYLKAISPELEVYVTPVNIDPGRPDLPISHPVTYSMYLAKLFGPYATLGLAEDTWALNEKVLDDRRFWPRGMAIMKNASVRFSMPRRKPLKVCAHAGSVRPTGDSTCSGPILEKINPPPG